MGIERSVDRMEAGTTLKSRLLPLVLLLAVVVSTSSCNLFATASKRSTAGPYDQLGAAERERVAEARRDRENGSRHRARAVLRFLTDVAPLNLPVAIALQELELEMLAAGDRISGMEEEPVQPGTEQQGPAERLRRLYRTRAEKNPTPVALVLAARLEGDGPAALALLDRALDIDSTCNWAHYGRAHVLAQAGDFRSAREALDLALRQDPGHLPSRRLEAAFLSRGSKLDLAIKKLESWLEDAEQDPLVDPKLRQGAELDLLSLYALTDDTDRVEDLADQLLERHAAAAQRIDLVVAAARISDRDPKGALRAAREAAEADPSNPLPHVQQAMVYDYWLDKPEDAYRVWGQVLELCRAASQNQSTGFAGNQRPEPASFQVLLFWVYAQARLSELSSRGYGQSAQAGTVEST